MCMGSQTPPSSPASRHLAVDAVRLAEKRGRLLLSFRGTLTRYLSPVRLALQVNWIHSQGHPRPRLTPLAASKMQSGRPRTMDRGMTLPCSDCLKSSCRVSEAGRTKPPWLRTTAIDPGTISLPVSSARRIDARSTCRSRCAGTSVAHGEGREQAERLKRCGLANTVATVAPLNRSLEFMTSVTASSTEPAIGGVRDSTGPGLWCMDLRISISGSASVFESLSCLSSSTHRVATISPEPSTGS